MKTFARAAATAAVLMISSAAAQEIAPVTPSAPLEPSAVAPVAAAPATTEATPAAAMTPEEAQFRAQAQAFYDLLHRQTGQISVAGGKVTLTVPETHYFIGPEDARRVLVDVWGNPPEAAAVEGMIFPRDGNPALGSWGAVVEYAAEGYVSDSDASTADYDQILRDMQSGAQQENETRTAQGYPSVTLVGWAERPHYEASTHKIYWAKHLQFSGVDVATLNYDIRALGREGYLVISFVATMPELEAIRQSAPAVLAMPEFTAGNRYADFREGDQRAAYGLGGLVAGGAALALAQKTGILAMILAFGKKFIVLIGVGLVALFGAIRRMFGGRKEADEAPPAA